jgi:hypothetical protein
MLTVGQRLVSGIAKFSDITTSTNEAFTLIYAAPEQLGTHLGSIDELGFYH